MPIEHLIRADADSKDVNIRTEAVSLTEENVCVKALWTHHKITTHKEKTDGWLYREKHFCWPL